MSAQHTLGPWVADRTCVRNAEGEHRFTVGITRTAYATARLIAAAPELLEALAELVDHRDRAPDEAHPDGAAGELAMWKRACAAIAKATGAA